MGSSDNDSNHYEDEAPIHKVYLDFLLDHQNTDHERHVRPMCGSRSLQL